MKKALWFLLRSFLQMTGMLLLFYAALIVLCLLSALFIFSIMKKLENATAA